MTTVRQFNKYGIELENRLHLSSSPIALKMLEKESDIPEQALRPKKNGYHLSQCQAFAMSRREGMTVAMLKEDNWCPAPVMAFGLAPKTSHPLPGQLNNYDCFEFGKYIGMVTAPLKKAVFKPDAVSIYCDTNQLRTLLLMLKMEERSQVDNANFPPSCAYAVVPPILSGRYTVVLPDPGEHSRALTQAGEMIFSMPAGKLGDLVENLVKHQNDDSKFANLPMVMKADFIQPELYKKIFKGWGMEHQE
jgi:uncharacterized protein (DUF169 family)